MYKILHQKGDPEQAGIHLEKAKQIVNSIAIKISDPEHRNSYWSEPARKELKESFLRFKKTS